jgi:hypothetical protein
MEVDKAEYYIGTSTHSFMFRSDVNVEDKYASIQPTCETCHKTAIVLLSTVHPFVCALTALCSEATYHELHACPPMGAEQARSTVMEQTYLRDQAGRENILELEYDFNARRRGNFGSEWYTIRPLASCAMYAIIELVSHNFNTHTTVAAEISTSG